MRGRSGRRLAASTRTGFTLVELLVVIGIIALLITMLLPVLGRARDSANKTACLSNIRQLVIAFKMYANDNKDKCPLAAPLSRPDLPGDWIHWRTGINNAGLSSSAIAPYLGGQAPAPNAARNTALEKIFRCPSDRLEDRPSFKQYPYSYTMNIYFGSDGNYPQNVAGPPIRLHSTRNASEKVILAEENEVTINDGYWVPGVGPSADPATWVCEWDWLSIRHDLSVKESADQAPRAVPLPQMHFKEKKGVCGFADGHADFVPRDYAHDPRHVIPRV